jgi:hypothetical protein
MQTEGRIARGWSGTAKSGLADRTAPRWRILTAATLLFLSLGALGCECDLEITTPFLPDGIVGVPYLVNLDSDCGGDTFFLVSGGLPPGMALQSDGDLGGIPGMAGTFLFTVGLVDFGSGDEAFRGYTLTLRNPEPTPSPTPS